MLPDGRALRSIQVNSTSHDKFSVGTFHRWTRRRRRSFRKRTPCHGWISRPRSLSESCAGSGRLRSLGSLISQAADRPATSAGRVGGAGSPGPGLLPRSRLRAADPGRPASKPGTVTPALSLLCVNATYRRRIHSQPTIFHPTRDNRCR